MIARDDSRFLFLMLSYASTVPIGKRLRNTLRTSGPATISWNGSAMIKFFGMFVSQMIGTRFQVPVWVHASNAPYRDMKNTIGTTMQVDTQIAFFSPLSCGFTRKRKANPFANPDTTNQSRHIANMQAIGNPTHASLIVSKFSAPM